MTIHIIPQTNMSANLSKRVTFGENTIYGVENISEYILPDDPHGFRMTIQRLMKVLDDTRRDVKLNNFNYMKRRVFFMENITEKIVDQIIGHDECVSINIHTTNEKIRNYMIGDLFTMLEASFKRQKIVKFIESDTDLISFEDTTVFTNLWIDCNGKLGGF